MIRSGKSLSLSLAGSVLIAGLLFLLLYGLLMLPFLLSRGEPVTGWSLLTASGPEPIALPYLLRMEETESHRFSVTLGELKDSCLCFTGLDVNALSAEMNGREFFRLGDRESPTANLWNSLILIPLPDSGDPENRLTLTLTGNFYISLSRIPTLERYGDALLFSSLHRFIYHDLIVLFMGAALLTGLLFILSGVTDGKMNYGDILFGVASLIIIIYALDYTYRISTGPFALYSLIKRAIISCAFLGGFAYLASIDYHCNGSFRLSRWLAIPSLISLAALLAVPGLPRLFRILPLLDLLLMVQFVIVAGVALKKRGDSPLYLIPLSLIILSILQAAIGVTFHPGSPLALPYVIVLSVSLFGVQFARDRREILEERDSLKRAWTRDPLTGAYNRNVLTDINSEEFSAAVFLDFDNFKYYNDRYGHDRGDELLKGFAHRAGCLLRQDDMLIRYGGDEFIILFRDAGEGDAAGVVERIRTSFTGWVEDSLVNFSYGIAPVGKGGSLNIRDLDRRMYSMKRTQKRVPSL